MKFFLVSFFLCIQLSTAASQALGETLAATETNYAYPYRDPYFASLTVGLLHAKSQPKEISIPGLPGRNEIPFFEGRGITYVEVYAQKKPAPLIYLIPGIGAVASEGTAEWLGEQLFREGFSVLIVASPMNWRFALAQGSSATPGYTPEDVKDLTRVIQIGEQKAIAKFGLKPTRKAVIGYSLGAIEAAYLMKNELDAKVLGIERAVMINPPLNLEFAISKLDELHDLGKGLGAQKQNALMQYLMAIGQKAIARDIDDPGYFRNLEKMFPFKSTQVQYLIGFGVRQSLGNTIFTTQQILDTGILQSPYNPDHPGVREAEAMSITYHDYITKVALPFWQIQKRGGTLASLAAQSDLLPLKELLAESSAFIMFHNQDDFLTLPGDLQQVQAAMGERCIVYPFGGHVGNIWNPENLQRLIRSVENLKY